LGPSIQQLDSAWGAKWRDQNERQFYSHRLPIIQAIQRRHASGQASSLMEAAVKVEALRTETHGGMSLNRGVLTGRREDWFFFEFEFESFGNA